MKITKLISHISIGLFAVLSVRAQSPFQNLDFEEANPVSVVGSPNYPYAVTVASALPFWTVSCGAVQQTQITYNDPSTGGTQVTLVGGNGIAIDGDYSVLLQGGGGPPSASIEQSGAIPDGTQSLLFEARPGSGPFSVQVGSDTVPFSAVGTGPDYTLYGANISAWANDTEPLTFTAYESSSGLNNWEIDDISFSPQAVPEPNTMELLLMGGTMFVLHGWRKRGKTVQAPGFLR